jgi:excisionase family DNA binding protein
MTDLSIDELMTDQQLQEFLGISRTTLWRLRKSAGLPFGKVGRCYRYRKSEVLRWISEAPEESEQLSLHFNSQDENGHAGE